MCTGKYSYRNIFIPLFLFFFQQAMAQPQFEQWAFGINAGLDFSNPPVTSSGPTAIDQVEGAASISDANGDLLFYTDGSTIWDATHQSMPNGSGLLGSFTCTQAVAIVQDPAACSRYYVFHNGMIPDNDVYWSLVDMDLNGGLGDVVVGQKNLLLAQNVDEKLTVVRHATDLAYWVLVHGNNSMEFRAYLVTATGIQAPVSTSIGDVYPPWAFGGQLKASPDGTRLVSLNNQCMLELFDFDAATGVISNYVPVHTGLSTWNQSIPAWVGRSYYGSEFSPNGQVLYVSGDGFLYQYDLTAGTALDIAATEDLIYGNYQPDLQVYGLQLAPDGNIYVAQVGRTTVAVINDPNVLGNGCDFDLNGVFIGPGQTQTTFPGVVGYFDDYLQSVDLGPDVSICSGDSIELSVSTIGDFLWSTGEITSSIYVYSAGTYWVEVTTVCGVGLDTIELLPNVPPTVEIVGPTTLCPGEQLTVMASDGSTDFLWNTGSVDPMITPDSSGIYIVELTHDCGTATDTSDIYIMPLPDPGLELSYQVCDDPVVIVLIDSIIYQALWSDGSTGFEASILLPADYDVLITDTAGCLSEFYFTLEDNCPSQLFVPNAFSPDGDGFNDYFLPITNHPETISYAIFDRWGQVVFEAVSGFVAWDGSKNGQIVPIGTYVWVVDKARTENSTAGREMGSVTVIR